MPDTGRRCSVACSIWRVTSGCSGCSTTRPPVALVGSRRATGYGLEVAHALGRELGACQVPGRQRHGARRRLCRPRGGARGRRPDGRRAGRRRRRPVPEQQAAALPAHRRAGAGGRRAATGVRPAALVLSRPQSDHGGAVRHDRGCRRGGGLRLAASPPQFAADLGREVGAVPGQVTSRLAQGPNALLADGACVVRSATDVLDALYGAGHPAAGERPQPRPLHQTSSLAWPSCWPPSRAAPPASTGSHARRRRRPT